MKKWVIFIKIGVEFTGKICVYKVVDLIMKDVHENKVILGKNW